MAKALSEANRIQRDMQLGSLLRQEIKLAIGDAASGGMPKVTVTFRSSEVKSPAATPTPV